MHALYSDFNAHVSSQSFRGEKLVGGKVRGQPRVKQLRKLSKVLHTYLTYRASSYL